MPPKGKKQGDKGKQAKKHQGTVGRGTRRGRGHPAAATVDSGFDQEVNAAIVEHVDSRLAAALQQKEDDLVQEQLDRDRDNEEYESRVHDRNEELAAQKEGEGGRGKDAPTEEVHDPVDEVDHEDQEEAVRSDQSEPAPKKRKKRKKVPFDVPEHTKEQLVDWYEAHPFFYDKTEERYKDPAYKESKTVEKAAERPPSWEGT